MSEPALVGPITSWRALTADDARALTDLYNASRRAEGLPDEVLAMEEIAHKLHDPGITLPTDSRGGFAADGSLLAWGSVWCRLAAVTLSRAIIQGDVHPEVRRSGIGSALIAWQQVRAEERLATELPPELPRRIDLYAVAGDAGREALAREAGLEPARWFIKMSREMAQPVRLSPVPAGLEVAAWTDDLTEAALDARNDAWRDHWGYEPMPLDVWRHLLVEDPSFQRPASRLAIADGRVVGFVLCTEQASEEAGDGRTAWLDLIAVRREWRRRGLASALISASLVALAEEGFRIGVLDVDADSATGALGLYERHGFRAVRTETLHARDLAP